MNLLLDVYEGKALTTHWQEGSLGKNQNWVMSCYTGAIPDSPQVSDWQHRQLVPGLSSAQLWAGNQVSQSHVSQQITFAGKGWHCHTWRSGYQNLRTGETTNKITEKQQRYNQLFLPLGGIILPFPLGSITMRETAFFGHVTCWPLVLTRKICPPGFSCKAN